MDDLKKTPLFNLHKSLQGKMVGFAGYALPVNYPEGILAEHLWTRENAGLFDVSHMGQIRVTAKSGDNRDAAVALERLVPVDVVGLAEGRQRYAVFTNEKGGVLDDLMIANRGDHFYLVVNAACKDADFAHLSAGLGDTCTVEWQDRALLALQGPRAVNALAVLAPEVAAMRFMDVRTVDILGARCIVSRSGYTGEDGFEISEASDRVAETARALLGQLSVKPIGLGARDSLRLEAGLCLYGHELSPEITPVEASIQWAIQKVRRKGGAREGGFPGASVILDQLENGAPRSRVGLRPEGRAPIRDGVEIYASDAGGEPIGSVTSGGFGPSVGGPVAIALVEGSPSVGSRLFAEVRGKRLPVSVAALPFVPAGFKR
ncbi:MAG TPA: glycine cleavage system aminomethyltransferase GcvT [Paracoccaceae bacterium]|nr:glycine cleavage system aminomethyltransferase GcvT [Paracoccaceae bacterium]